MQNFAHGPTFESYQKSWENGTWTLADAVCVYSINLVHMLVFLPENYDTIFAVGDWTWSSFHVNCVVIWQIETMFEKYNFGAVFIQIQAVLTLYAQGESAVLIQIFKSSRESVYVRSV